MNARSNLLMLLSVFIICINHSYGQKDSTMFKKGIQSFNDNNLQQSVVYFTDQLNNSPFKMAYLSRAYCYVMLNMNNEALADYKIIFKKYINKKDRAQEYINMANTVFTLGNYKIALYLYKKAISNEPKNTFAKTKITECKWYLKTQKEQAHLYKKSLAHHL